MASVKKQIPSQRKIDKEVSFERNCGVAWAGVEASYAIGGIFRQ